MNCMHVFGMLPVILNIDLLYMCMYMCVSMYICVYMCVYVYVSVYMYVYIYMLYIYVKYICYIYIYTHIYMYILTNFRGIYLLLILTVLIKNVFRQNF